MVKQPKFKHLNPPVLAMGFLLVMSLSACQQAAVPAAQRFSSEQGVNIEAFLPADTFLLAKAGTRDQDQLDTLKTLNGYFPNDPLGIIVKQFNEGFKQGANLNEVGLDYDQDILPILNNKSQFFFAMSPDHSAATTPAPAATTTNADGTAATAAAVKPKVNMFVAMTIADQAKFDALVEKQTGNNILKKDDYNGQAIYSEVKQSDTAAYISRDMDTVFLSTNLDLLKAGLDNVKANKDLLAANPIFQRAMNAYKPNLAIVYADLGEVVSVLGSSEGKNSEDMAKALSGTDAANIESEVLVMTAEKDGIRLASKVLGKSGVDLSKTQNAGKMQAYMMNKIPAGAPIFYLEGSGLKSSYDNMIKTLGTEQQFTDGMNQMKDFLQTQGLDWDKDVLSFMDKGVAVVFEDSGSPIPGLGIYLDASSNLDGAQKTVTALNKGFDGLLAEAISESPDISMILSKQEVVPGKLWKFKINLDAILATAPSEMAKKLTGQKVEFYYGLLDDGVITMALKPDLEKVYGKDPVVQKSSEFAQAMNLVGGEHRGVAYIAPAQLVSLVDTYLKMVADSTGQVPAIPEYDQVKPDVEPLKSLIFSGGAVKSDEVEAQFFLHIAQ